MLFDLETSGNEHDQGWMIAMPSTLRASLPQVYSIRARTQETRRRGQASSW
jgi:hypothetical protein